MAGRTKREWWDVPQRPEITRYARQLWRFVYREPWPEGWRVMWVVERGCPRQSHFAGLTMFPEKLVLIEYRNALRESVTDALVSRYAHHYGDEAPRTYWDFLGVWEILLHEFTHMRDRRLGHRPEFRRRLDEAKRRLMRGCAPTVETRRAA